MEILDIYDKNRVKTGETHERWRKQPIGDYHLVVFIAVFNSTGQMLVQQRQPFKQGWSGFWDITAGGAAISGDTSQQAASRELYEEVGITVDFSEATPHFTINTERTFCDFYLHQMDIDIDSLQLGEDEVAQVKWVKRRRTLKYDEV